MKDAESDMAMIAHREFRVAPLTATGELNDHNNVP
jgi:hypothetical protein